MNYPETMAEFTEDPKFRSFNWMTPEEQILHLIDEHGYTDSWVGSERNSLDVANVWWANQTPEQREWEHANDHVEYIGGGGDVPHDHALVDEREVTAAIESIKRTANK